MSYIHIRGLEFSYVNELEEPPVVNKVLKGIDLDIEKGEFVAVLGHNGSGKSTLAKCINAINLPEKGEVVVDGLDTIQEDNLLPIRKRVGMVFQNPDNQIVATIVEEDVAFALENLGVEPSEIRRRVDEALKTVGMYEYRMHAPHKLSGGQKQRVAIAGILAMKPDCIVLDEPTAMLDPQGRNEVLKTIKMLNGYTIKFVHTTQKNLAYKNRLLQMLVFALKDIGKDNITGEQAQRTRELLQNLPLEQIKDDLGLMPAWIKDFILEQYEQQVF